MNQIINEKPILSVNSRIEWRQWLAEHHDTSKEIWLILFNKHSGKQFMTKVEAVDDAICFGWIDSLVKGIDAEKYMQKFTPRKPDSQWSEVNKRRVVMLETQSLIEAPGKILIDHARATGEWFKNRDVPSEIETPPDLIQALIGTEGAMEKWEKLPPSHRDKYLLWINQAKREITKQNRIIKAIKMLTSNQSPSML